MERQLREILEGWQAAQRVFWQAAASKPAFHDASAFAPPDWRAFDGFVTRLTEEVLPEAEAGDVTRVQQACAAYRDIVAGAWMRIREDFEAQRRAMWDPAAPPDWRILRDRWLAIAEAEFIRTQRGPDFVAAQARLLGATVALMERVPEETRRTLAAVRRSAGDAATTMGRLGLDGVQIAATPKREIWRDGPMTLSRYHPLTDRAAELGPVVICYGLIGRQTMTDLVPDRSAVRQLLAAGVDVFVVDWGNAGAGETGLGLDRIVGQRLPAALKAACEVSGAERPILFGICQGGTLAACHAALHPDSLAGLILAVTPIDFHADQYDADPAHGLVHVWLRGMEAEDLDRLIGLEGNLSGALLGSVFNQLNPVRTLAKYAVGMPGLAGNPAGFRTFMAMEKWLADRPDLPGRLAHEWMIGLYKENRLAKGALEVGGRPVRLAEIGVPVLNVYATGDHIVPPPCSRALGMLLADAGRYRELAVPTGHIGAFVSERAQSLLVPEIVRWLRSVQTGA